MIKPIKIEFPIRFPTGQSISRFVYCYLIFSNRVVAIDTGVKGSDVLIYETMKSLGRVPSDLKTVVLTHGHADHMGSAASIGSHHKVNILAHANEQHWIEDIETQLRDRAIPSFHQLVAGSVHIDRLLHEGDTVDLGDGIEGLILHTPGHSPGGISIHLRTLQALFTGDALPLPGDMPLYDDVQTYVRSIKRIMSIPQIKELYSSWHEPIFGEEEARKTMEASLRWLQTIHLAIREVAGPSVHLDPIALCRKVIGKLNLPLWMANPLVAKSFLSHLPILDIEDIQSIAQGE